MKSDMERGFASEEKFAKEKQKRKVTSSLGHLFFLRLVMNIYNERNVKVKQIIREILEGKFRYDNDSLNFSCPSIEMSIQAGECKEDSFIIYGQEGILTEGYIISTDLRMECLTASFSGSQDEIFYRVDASESMASSSRHTVSGVSDSI